VKVWLDLPVTQTLYRVLKEKKEDVINRLLSIEIIDHNKMGEIAQLKGQINAIDEMLDIETYFEGEFSDEDL
jgi:hypothetical protein